jgi:hypothetical protein
LISYNSKTNYTKRRSRKDMAVNGESITVENRLKSLCNLPEYERLQRINVTKTSNNENIVSK